MKRAKCTIVIFSLALASCRGPAASPGVSPQVAQVRIMATTATDPLLQDFVMAYHPPGILFAVTRETASWQTVYAQVGAGEVPFGLTTYLPAEAGWWAAPIGQDGLAVIVHPSSPITALSIEQLRRLFQGQIISWAELGGPDVPVVLVSQEKGADSWLAFDSLVMGGRRTSLGARLALSGQSMVEMVSSEPGAVGYVSMAYLTPQVRAVAVASEGEAIPLTRETVNRKTYPLQTPILVIGRVPPAEDDPYHDWFAWMQSAAGQAVLERRYAGPQS
ncbi:MAG: substrate-binding domain-containing protein [Chloroflexi bacterium]|nr:substrate-binding domain-containing protein [Chloroflexota bacterium]